ncbi:MAG: hypothetical protein PHU85_12470 [Phycisphaerae bacterium]|nr:hypothetical protein [Phycisphaerae bacterium]
MNRLLALVAIACLFACPALAEVKVPLVVQESGGVDRAANLITSGVPLLPGQVTDMSKLVLLDASGKPVACQFRDLARWRADNSLRWVLLDFKANLTAWGATHFTLSDAGQAPADSPLKAAVTDDAIVVNTGPAQFTINRKKFNLFDRVRLDVNGDKEFSDDEEVLSPSADNGSVVTDTFGEKYFSGEGTTEVKVEESGPVRVCVVARGTHKARDGKGYSLGMYGFEVRMHFIVGTNLVKLDALITNNGAKCNGSPTFKDYSLIGKLNLAKTGRVAKMYGMAPVDISVATGQSATVYQDSVGSENWKVSPGVNGQPAGGLSSFRGYRIIHQADGKDTVLHQGDNARGLTEFGDAKFGVVIAPNYFWQLFPKAVQVSGDGTFRVGLLPGEYKAVHFIEDASAAGQVIWMAFYATKQKQFAADPEGKPWPHVVDDSYFPRAMARCTNEHYAACGALADVGPYLPISTARPGEGQVENEPIGVFTGDFPLEVTERRYMMTDYLKGNAFGWQVFGCRWEEYAGHSPWNYEPIGSSYFLFNYINTGGLRMLEFGLRRSKQFRDVRAYKIDGTDLWHCPNWGEYARNNVAEEWCSRSSQWPKGEEVTKYSAGKYGRAGWTGPNPEHANLDDLHDLYLLTGDTRAGEGMRNIAAYGGAFAATRAGDIGRATGWAFRAVARYYDLTGDKNAADYFNRCIEGFWATARNARSAPMVKYDNNWFMDVYSRAAVIAFNTTGDERMRDLVIGLSRGRANQPDAKQAERKYGWPTMLAFCWDQTGLPEFANENPQKYARLGGYFPSCAGYLWAKPRDDKQAPAAIKDLAGKPVDGGVELTWTAPGDDGDKGTAAVYQIKYDDLPLVEQANGGKESSFWAANNVPDEPKPAAAGAKQTYTAKGLKAGTYHFAIKTRDEVNNESPISNVVSVEVK